MTRPSGNPLKPKKMTIEELAIIVSNGFVNLKEELLGEMDARFTRVDERFAEIDRRFEQIDKRFAQMDKRFDRLEPVVLEHEHRINRLEDKVFVGI